MDYEFDPYTCYQEYEKLRKEFEEVNYDFNLHIEYTDYEIKHLTELVLEMGHIIRYLDEEYEYLEYWTQDGEYNYFEVDKEKL